MRITMFGSLLLLAAAGCEKEDPLFCQMNPGASGCPQPDGSTGDAGADTALGIDARSCFGTGGYELCFNPPPSNPVVLNAGTFDTSPGNTACVTPTPTDWTDGQDDACIVIGGTITVPDLDVVGTRPLVLVAATTLTLTGTLDASSRTANPARVGAGSPFMTCASFVATPGNNNAGGGGGAGGSFITKGGDGGDGDNGARAKGQSANQDPTAPVRLRAGCAGQRGGNGEDPGGSGGAGGGAVYLAAGTSIVLNDNAVINASGAGGGKAGRSGGGGGGGTGGMIVLNAPTITIGTMVHLLANGGGGASGGNDTSNCPQCNPGADPDPTDPLGYAPGGTGGGGPGGGGWAKAIPATNGQPGASNLAGGGGGGGGGYIQSSVALTNAVTSPDPVVQ